MRVRIHIRNELQTWPAALVRFDPPRRVDEAAVLTKLSPLSGPLTRSLECEERDGAIVCLGMRYHWGRAGIGERVPDWESQSAEGGLWLEVRGPGWLRLFEAESTSPVRWELRNGQIRRRHYVDVVPAIADWWGALDEQLLRSTDRWIARLRQGAADDEVLPTLKTGAVAEHRGKATGAGAPTAGRLWERIWSRAIAARHGGAFVILPEGASTASLPVKHGQRVADGDPLDDLACGAAASVWAARARQAQDANALERATHAWLGARRKCERWIHAIARLSEVDGCVVVSHDARILSFGAEIRVDRHSVADVRCVRRDRSPSTVFSIERLGTRHRSAFRLCGAVLNAVAVVISQDGVLSVFHGASERRVELWRDLEALKSQYVAGPPDD